MCERAFSEYSSESCSCVHKQEKMLNKKKAGEERWREKKTQTQLIAMKKKKETVVGDL
jgi:hypothetical protein